MKPSTLIRWEAKWTVLAGACVVMVTRAPAAGIPFALAARCKYWTTDALARRGL